MESDDTEFNLKEWDTRARERIISRQNTGSRRFSASHVRTLREEARSFRTNFTVSSTASSPGYLLRDEIDPSTYSFTSALKALQAKQRYVNVWDSMSPEGFVLNSKWSDAERYICNPLSGEVPMECLSAKTLSQRSFRNVTSRVTMSAPLVYPSHYPRHAPPSTRQNSAQIPIQEEKAASDMVRSISPSPASTPSIGERNVKRCISEAEESRNSESKVISEEEGEETREGEDDENETENETETENGEAGKDDETSNGQVCMKRRQGGCLSWMMAMRRKEKNNNKNHKSRGNHKLWLFLPRNKGC